MSIVSLRLDQREEELIRKYAELHQISVSELIRTAVMELIETEIDIELYEKAVAETNAVYSLEQVKSELKLQ